MPDLRTQWVGMGLPRAEALVVRWNLNRDHSYRSAGERYAPFDQLLDPDPATREALAKAMRWALGRDRPVWIMANNNAEGCAPDTLEHLVRAWRALGDPP